MRFWRSLTRGRLFSVEDLRVGLVSGRRMTSWDKILPFYCNYIVWVLGTEGGRWKTNPSWVFLGNSMCLTQGKKKKSPRYFQVVLSCFLTIFVLFSYGYVSEENSGKTEDRGEEMYNLGGSQKTRGVWRRNQGSWAEAGTRGEQQIEADRGLSGWGESLGSAWWAGWVESLHSGPGSRELPEWRPERGSTSRLWNGNCLLTGQADPPGSLPAGPQPQPHSGETRNHGPGI